MEDQFIVEKIPFGSYSLRIFDKDDDPKTSPTKFVCNLIPKGYGVVEISSALGKLSDKRNVYIGQIAHSLGFKILRFHVAKGQQVSRHAVYVSSDLFHDFYEVNLVEELG